MGGWRAEMCDAAACSVIADATAREGEDKCRRGWLKVRCGALFGGGREDSRDTIYVRGGRSDVCMRA